MSQLPFACRLFTLPIKSAFLYDRRSGLHSSYEQFVVLYRQQSVISPCVLSKRSDQTAACQKWSTVIKGMTNFGKTAVGLWTRIGWLTESVLFVYALCTTSKVQIPGLGSDFFFFNNWFFYSIQFICFIFKTLIYRSVLEAIILWIKCIHLNIYSIQSSANSRGPKQVGGDPHHKARDNIPNILSPACDNSLVQQW